MADEDAPPIACSLSLRQTEPNDVVLGVLHTGELNKLRACPIAIEREGDTGIPHVAVRVAVSPEYETAVLGPFIVIEQHAGIRPIHGRSLFTSGNHARQACMVGNH